MKRRSVIIVFGGGIAISCFFLGFILFTRLIFSYVAEDGQHEVQDVSVLNKEKEVFVPYQKYEHKDNDARVIALYLPQYHQFKENDEWHGKGFTEWTNVRAAKPLFEGHYQPKLPIDVGFYDLSNPDVMKRQIELARNYGVDGFAFYYYWFSGKKLMEKPVYNYLKDKELNFPFCLTWANESWSKRWDGGNGELLIEQKFSEADFEAFAKDLLPFFKDKRYIKINGRPVLVIYRPALFGKEVFRNFVYYLKDFMAKEGIKAPYLIGTKQFGFWENPEIWGLDAEIGRAHV